MATLLLVEHDNNQLNAVTRNAVGAARELGGEVTLLVAGENCRPVAEQAARIAPAQVFQPFSAMRAAVGPRLFPDTAIAPSFSLLSK